MHENIGQIEIEAADDANVPVDIWLEPVDPDADGGYEMLLTKSDWKWRLRASNYMPRKGRVEDGVYHAVAETREELVELVHKYWLPLYSTAVEVLSALHQNSDGAAGLYYWKKRLP